MSQYSKIITKGAKVIFSFGSNIECERLILERKIIRFKCKWLVSHHL
jgi:hypothetical protein